MNRITRDEFIEWIRQNFPNNVNIEFKHVWVDRSGNCSEQLHLDNSSFNTINFADEP